MLFPLHINHSSNKLLEKSIESNKLSFAAIDTFENELKSILLI